GAVSATERRSCLPTDGHGGVRAGLARFEAEAESSAQARQTARQYPRAERARRLVLSADTPLSRGQGAGERTGGARLHQAASAVPGLAAGAGLRTRLVRLAVQRRARPLVRCRSFA